MTALKGTCKFRTSDFSSCGVAQLFKLRTRQTQDLPQLSTLLLLMKTLQWLALFPGQRPTSLPYPQGLGRRKAQPFDCLALHSPKRSLCSSLTGLPSGPVGLLSPLPSAPLPQLGHSPSSAGAHPECRLHRKLPPPGLLPAASHPERGTSSHPGNTSALFGVALNTIAFHFHFWDKPLTQSTPPASTPQRLIESWGLF